MSSMVIVSRLPKCTLCALRQHQATARFDGKTKAGPWAFMCETCFKDHGVGLGTGKGQRLSLKGEL